MPVGTYKVDIALEGFKTKSYTDLIVNVGQEVLPHGKARYRDDQRNRHGGGRQLADQDDDPGSDIDGPAEADARHSAGEPGRHQPDQGAGGRSGVHQSHQYRDQRRPSDLDTGHARRHQHPGQLHPYQLSRLPPEPAELRQRRGVLDYDVGVGCRRRRWRHVGPHDHALRYQSVHGKRVRVQSRQQIRGELFLQQFNHPVDAEAGIEPPSVRRSCGWSDSKKQAVLLRQLRRHAADPAAIAESGHSGERRFLQRGFPLRRDRRRSAVRQPDVADRSHDRSEAAERVPVTPAGSIEGQQLPGRQLHRGASAEYCRIPVQPDRLQQSRSVHVPGRLHGD